MSCIKLASTQQFLPVLPPGPLYGSLWARFGKQEKEGAKLSSTFYSCPLGIHVQQSVSTTLNAHWEFLSSFNCPRVVQMSERWVSDTGMPRSNKNPSSIVCNRDEKHTTPKKRQLFDYKRTPMLLHFAHQLRFRTSSEVGYRDKLKILLHELQQTKSI